MGLLFLAALTRDGFPTLLPSGEAGAGVDHPALAIGFEPNLGQAEEGISYLARGGRYTLAFQPEGVALYLAGEQRPSLRLRFPGANRTPRLEAIAPLGSSTNYLLGDDPEGWVSSVPSYDRLLYRDLYPGIDLLWYGNGRWIEYDFLVAPGADPKQIGMVLEEVKAEGKNWVDPSGNLHAGRGEKAWMLRAPTIYQPPLGEGVDPVGEPAPTRSRLPSPPEGSRHVEGSYDLQENGEIRFALGEYDVTRPLVIDPVLEFSTYFGGTGMDVANVVRVDRSGNIYLAGETESINFPTRTGLSSTLGGSSDGFVVKLNPSGTAILFSTFLGGRNPGDRIWDLQVDEMGRILVCGETNSLNFPVTEDAAQRFFRGNTDGFLSILTPDGRTLAYSTYLGGSLQDIAYGLALEEGGSVVLTGQTRSSNFPTRRALQPDLLGASDVFLTRIDKHGELQLSTHLGGPDLDPSGTGEEIGYSIAVDPEGNIYLAGLTGSPGFPTVRAVQPRFGGVEDGFVCKLAPSGETILYSTFLGSSRSDTLRGLAVDSFGQAHVTGSTFFADYPTASPLQPNYRGNTDAFVTKLSARGDRLLFSTFLGGTGPENIGTLRSTVPSSALAIDRVGNLYLAGKTGSRDFPMVAPLQGELHGDSDSYLSVIDPAGSSLLFSTFFGSRFTGINWVDERALGVTVNPSGTIYLAGQVLQNDLLTKRAIQGTYGGGLSDAFLAVISSGQEGRLAPVSAASYVGGTFAPGSIVAVFGKDLAPMSELATSLPLPTSLQGTRVEVTDQKGDTREAPLFFVSPFQLNVLIPPETAEGRVRLTVRNPISMPGGSAEAMVWLDQVAPAIFSANGDGLGAPAGWLLRVLPEGTIRYEPIAQLSPEGRMVPVPLDLGGVEEVCYLILFGTGWRQAGGPSAVSARIGTDDLPVLFVGPQESFVGLDQLNLALPRGLANQGSVRLILKANGLLANVTELRFGAGPR
jgi:uncharacterized protein (TIGR03437 family)